MPRSPAPRSGTMPDTVLTLVLALADAALRRMSDVSSELKAAPPEIREKTRFMLAYVTLYHAGMLCFESLSAAKDLSSAEAFDDELHAAFEKRMGENPKPHIRRYLQYAEKVGDRGYVQFVGFSIAEALGKRDVLFAVEMCKVYTDVVSAKLEEEVKKILG